MKNRKIFLLIAVMILSILIPLAYAQNKEKVELKLNLQKGQSYKIQTVSNMKINQMVPGQQQVITMTQNSGTKNTYTVEDTQSDSNLLLKITYDGIFSKIESPNQMEDMNYNSADPSTAGDLLAPVLGAIVGQSLTAVITTDGHVKEIKGIDTLWARIQGKINELPENAGRAGIETNLRAQYSGEGLKQNIENSFDMYPDKPISIGDTWQRRTVMSNQAFPMIVDTIYTLKERKNGIAVIDIFAMIQPNREASPTEMGDMKLQYNISGSVTGSLEMQESTGWPVRSNQTLKLTGSVIIQSPQMQQPMSVPMSINGTITQEPY